MVSLHALRLQDQQEERHPAALSGGPQAALLQALRVFERHETGAQSAHEGSQQRGGADFQVPQMLLQVQENIIVGGAHDNTHRYKGLRL